MLDTGKQGISTADLLKLFMAGILQLSSMLSSFASYRIICGKGMLLGSKKEAGLPIRWLLMWPFNAL